MTERFLLYIDILGFTEMVKSEPRKVARIYSILDTLNVHKHDSFKTIVFSDTILVYNIDIADNDKDRQYYVWYLIEFAEDLHHRLTGQDIFFRAVLVAGDFSHYNLKHVECFYGDALIFAHNAEKIIPALGLFIDRECEKYNEFFEVEMFNSGYFFVYLNRSLEALDEYSGGKFPIENYKVNIGDIAPHATWQIRFLQDVYEHMRKHPEPLVRAKFLAAWDLYRRRFPQMLKVLEDEGFNGALLGKAPDWDLLGKTMNRDISFFKRIGSGTEMSMSITKSNRYQALNSKKLNRSKPSL